jgi:Transposase IS200 like
VHRLAHPLLEQGIPQECSDFGAVPTECNGEDHHVHLLVEYPPKVSVAALVNSLKGVSRADSGTGTRSVPTASTCGSRLIPLHRTGARHCRPSGSPLSQPIPGG